MRRTGQYLNKIHDNTNIKKERGDYHLDTFFEMIRGRLFGLGGKGKSGIIFVWVRLAHATPGKLCTVCVNKLLVMTS